MHDHDFEIIEQEELETGKLRLFIHVKAADLKRHYLYDPDTGQMKLDDEPLLVGGHDMTSIIGKKIREWVASLEEL